MPGSNRMAAGAAASSGGFRFACGLSSVCDFNCFFALTALRARFAVGFGVGATSIIGRFGIFHLPADIVHFLLSINA
jgi:hypothetical protein